MKRKILICMFCKGTQKQDMRKVQTLGLSDKIRKCALKLGDRHMIAETSTGDLVALDACYHLGCLTEYYRKVEISVTGGYIRFLHHAAW